MLNKTNHRSRLETVLSGKKPDRVPISFWRHFPVDDQTPEGLASAIIDFQKKYDFDFVKITPSSSFCLADWGIQDVWKGNPEGTRDYLEPLIKTVEDFKKIRVLDPKKGKLNDQLKCLSLIAEQLPDSTPFIQTIFSPLAQFKNIVGRLNIPFFIRCYPIETKSILQIISNSTIQFIEECKKRKIDGIFYAVQSATFDQLSEREFIDYGKYFDLQVLSHVNDLWLNVLHIHGDRIMFDQVKDYPCSILNWHDRETAPTLSEAKRVTDKVLCGGISRIDVMVLGGKKEIENQVRDALEQTDSLRFILSTGCVLMLTTPQSNLEMIRSLVNSF